MPEKKCTPGDSLWYDRVLISRWRLSGVSLKECIARATQNERRAKLYGLSQRRGKSFVRKWFSRKAGDTKIPFADFRAGKRNRGSLAFKRETVREFLHENHSRNVSLAAYIRSTARDVSRTSLRSWLRDPNITPHRRKIRGYSYGRIPRSLDQWQKRAALEYAISNADRDWTYVAFTDEGHFDLAEAAKLIKGGKLKYYTHKGNKHAIPNVVYSKWNSTRVSFFVMVTYDDRAIVTLENKNWTPPPTQHTIPPTQIALDVDMDLPLKTNRDGFEPRAYPKRKHRPRGTGRRASSGAIIDATVFIERCLPIVESWWTTIKQTITGKTDWSAEKKQSELGKYFVIHDNCPYGTSTRTKHYIEEKGLCVYPAGNYYGVVGGFPPFRPDFNYPAEMFIGELKRRTAQRVVDEVGLVANRCSPILLGRLLREECQAIPQEYIVKLYRKVPEILTQCVEARGGYGAIARSMKLPRTEQQETE